MVIRSVRTLWRIVIIIATFVLLVGTIEVRGQVVTGTGLTIGSPPTPPQGSTVRITGIGTENGPLFTGPNGDLLKRFLIRTDLPAGIAWLADNQTFTGLNTFGSLVTLPSMRSSSAQLPLTIRNSGNTADIFMFSNSGALALVPFIADQNASFNKEIDVEGMSNLNGIDNRSTLNQSGLSTFGADVSIIGANLKFGGFGRRIIGDFSHGALANRTSFVTSTVNGSTTIQALPAGTGTASAFTAYSQSDPANAPYTILYNDGTYSMVGSGVSGTGTALPLSLFVAGAEKMRWNSNDDHIMLGAGQAGIRYFAQSNVSGQRWWRAGNYGNQFGVWAGTDDGSTYSPLWYGTVTGGIANGMWWGTALTDVSPTKNYQTNLGRLTQKYLGLNAAELWVENLVAHETMATMGGRILVGPTTTLTTDLTTGATTIQTKHNNLQNGDTVYMEGHGSRGSQAVEFMRVTSGASIAYTGDPIPATFVSSATGQFNPPASWPTHAAGDLMIVGFMTSPAATPAAGWTTICSRSSSPVHILVAAKIATSSSEPVGTWAGANGFTYEMQVYRAPGIQLPTGAQCAISTSPASTPGTSIAFSALPYLAGSWGVRFSFPSLAKPPAGFTLLGSNGVNGENYRTSAAFTSAGTIAAESISPVGGGNVYWSTATIEIPAGRAAAGYVYSVTRNLEGSPGPDAWAAGDAVFNTGQTGNGFIDIYSTRGVRAGSEIGPTIVGNVRTANGYNDWAPRWAIGNLGGLYGNSAGTYGSAFGDYADVWVQTDATYGFRGMDGTTQRFILHPSGYLAMGNPSEHNVYIDGGQVALRSGVSPRLQATTNAVSMWDNGGTLKMQLTPAYMRFYDASGSNYAFDYNTSNGVLTMGYRHTGTHPNIMMAPSGDMTFSYGATTRMLLSAGNGSMTWYDPSGVAKQQIRGDGAAQFGGVDAGARVTMAGGNLDLMNSNNQLRGRLQADGFFLGDWYSAANQTHFYVSPTQAQFCRTGVNCPLIFYGSTGDIYSAGNIYLQGGQIRSSNNFVLGDSQGMAFEQWTSTSMEGNRSIRFIRDGATAQGWIGQDRNGSLRIRSTVVGGGTGIRLTLGDPSGDPYTEAGMFMTREYTPGLGIFTNITMQNIPYAGDGNSYIQLVPIHSGAVTYTQSYLGTASYWWSRIYGSQYYANGSAGFTGYTYFRNQAGTGTCWLQFIGGIMIANGGCT